MGYQLGIDVGTTYSAAAVHRDGRAAVASLGGRAPSVPSVVFLREDGTFLTGDAAERRSTAQPERVVREFKRRLGDSTPIIVAGSPYSAEALTSRLLAAIVAQVVQTEGAEPEKIVVTHPANWGDFKVDLLAQATRLAGLDPDVVSFITEPEAAAISYAAQERVEPGEIIAVYDLGGGTFDAAVLRRTVESFEIIGRPEGIERLGGIDFDAAVFAHVGGHLGDVLTELDPEDAAAVTAVARLRRDCVEAKEALSSDTDAIIPILIPRNQTEVRITRSEFEGLIRPSLLDTIGAMERAVASADLEMSDVSRILLVGGSSRIPVVSQLVSSQLARPVAVDTHPKHTVAVGAAFAAGGALEKLETVDEIDPGPELSAQPAPSGRHAGPDGDDDGESENLRFQAGQTRLSSKPLPGPQLFRTPEHLQAKPAEVARPAPAAKPEDGSRRRPPAAGVRPPAAGAQGSSPAGGPASSPAGRRPPKARPVTSPGLAPPPASPPGRVRPRGNAAAGDPSPAARPDVPRTPAKAKPVAFPGGTPPKAKPITSPITPPPGSGTPPGAPPSTPPGSPSRPPVPATSPLVTPRAAAGTGNPDDATVVYPSSAPPGLTGLPSNGGSRVPILAWLALAAVVVVVVVVVVQVLA